MSYQIHIEKNVPIPEPLPGRGGRPPKYPFREMEVGDSFFFAGTPKTAKRLYVSASKFGKRNNRRYAVRSVEGGYRVWRVE